MKILDKISDNLKRLKDKRKEKKLINADDEFVINSLPELENNSNINIKEVVKNMDNPENMFAVVENNLLEIIEQDNVKSTLKYLNDEDVFKILEKNQETLKQKKKIKYAIEAIDDNEKKLKAVFKNIRSLEDLDLARILNNLTPEQTEERKEKIEQQKIKIVGMKILEHIINHGAVWHIHELTNCLQEDSKILLLDLCVNSIEDYKNKDIDSKVKTKLVVDLFKVINVSSDEKNDIVDRYIKKDVFSEKEEKLIREELEKESEEEMCI